MRKTVKMQILQLLNTLKEAHKEVQDYWQKQDYEKVQELLADCQEAAILIGNTIEQAEEEHNQIIQLLEKYVEQLYVISMRLEETTQDDIRGIKEDLDMRISDVYKDVESKIKGILKVVFFPYKASMWTCLESVWKAAEVDEECEAKVVAIPYCTLKSNGTVDEVKYEGELFPEDVSITPYNEYHVEKEQPDMIFIHNPYDNRNTLTRVPECYYSYNLKKYTTHLVYSPYGMIGYHNPDTGSFMCETNAAIFADKILVQSERAKQIYMKQNIPEGRIMALGSPKVDAIVNKMKEEVSFPDGWREKLSGRKVFLLNTHLSYFLKGLDYQKKYNLEKSYAEVGHEMIFERLLNQENCALIWRPHPLLKTMLESRNAQEALRFVEDLEQRIKESNNAVLDEMGDYTISFRISDALLTTYSSIIPEYMISGKPIYIYESRLNEENCHNSPVDYTNNYYKAGKGEKPQFPEFVKMVLAGEDPLCEKRMADVNKAFSNLQGTIGQEIYESLKANIISGNN